jgi:hypothetical protein
MKAARYCPAVTALMGPRQDGVKQPQRVFASLSPMACRPQVGFFLPMLSLCHVRSLRGSPLAALIGGVLECRLQHRRDGRTLQTIRDTTARAGFGVQLLPMMAEAGCPGVPGCPSQSAAAPRS